MHHGIVERQLGPRRWRIDVFPRTDGRQPFLEPFEVGFGLLNFGIAGRDRAPFPS
jgi:hypothetical protein